MNTLLAPVNPAVPLLPVSRNSSLLNNSRLSRISTSVHVPCLPSTARLSNVRFSLKPILQPNFQSLRGKPLISISDNPSQANSNLRGRYRTSMYYRAANKAPLIPPYPEMTEKPKWWWRSLACLPYMMPLHQIMLYGASTFHIHPFFENNEHLTHSFFYATATIPNWAWMFYFTAAFFGICRRKECPHFFRFHLLMGMLLEICLQILSIGSGWLPLGAYYGRVGIPMLRAVAFAYLFTVLESIKCVLLGMYNDIPFVSDAAYIQTTL